MDDCNDPVGHRDAAALPGSDSSMDDCNAVFSSHACVPIASSDSSMDDCNGVPAVFGQR